MNNADRERIDFQWNGRSRGANPPVVDRDWREVVVRHLPATCGLVCFRLLGVVSA